MEGDTRNSLWKKYISIKNNEFFLDFLILCKLRNFKIFIISHKTKYGHYDNETLLREKHTNFCYQKNNKFKYFTNK